MPDFDKDLNPILTNTKNEVPVLDNPATPVPRNYSALGGFPDLRNGMAENPIFGKRPVISQLLPTVSAGTLYSNRRYATYDANIVDIEDQKAYAQSAWDKATNGVLKGLNLTATTIAGGFGMLYGAAKSPFTGRLADIWDNEVMRGLDEWNNEVDQVYLPNYYTNIEKDAAWYSTDNWFKTNFLFDKLIKNSGYAVGAMLSGNIANAGLLRAGSALGRFAAAGAASAESSQAFKLFTPLLRNTARAFSAGKNIEAAAVLEKEISSIADVTARSSKLAEIAKVTNKFADFGQTARRTAVAAYSSAGEASFEALQTAKEYRENLIEEYKSNNFGQEPSGIELEKINQLAETVGKTSFFGNLAILGITEYAQLPKLLGSSYAAERQAANSFVREAGDVVKREGKYVAAAPTTRFGKIYSKVSGVARYIIDPKESLQEGAQYALQVGTQNYFNKVYQSKDADVWVDGFLHGFTGVNEQGEGVGAFNSKEGAEGMLLGALTGGLMQTKGRIAEKKALRSNTETFIDGLNKAPTFRDAFKERLAAANRGIVLQEQQQEAIVQGDKLEAKDLDADMMHNYLVPRIKYGRLDMLLEDVGELQQLGMTNEGLASLKQQGIANINDTVDSYQKRLSSFITTAKNTAEIYKSFDLRFSGEVLKDEQGNPILDSDGRQQRKYSPLVIDKMVYAASKVADYDLRIPQVNSSLVKAGINTQDVIDSIIKDGKPNKEATAKALNDINSLDVLDTVKDELKSDLSDVIELSLRRKMFIQEHNDIKEKPLNYDVLPGYGYDIDEKDKTPVDVVQKEIDAEDKRKETTKKLEIGKEYSLKEALTKEGSQLQLAPKITVLSQTLGGELEVKLPNGRISFMTPEQFKKYNISDENNTSQEMADVLDKAIDTVLKEDKYAEIKKEMPKLEEGQKLDVVGWVNSLDNQELIDDIEKEFDKQTKAAFEEKERIKKEAERLKRSKDEIQKQQKEVETKSGTVATGDPTKETWEEESMLKDAAWLFTSGTTESEDWSDPTQSSPHVKRSRQFLNKAKTFSNRNKLRAILVTPKQVKALGLEGIIQLSYKKDLGSDVNEIEGVNDVDNGFIAQVFTIQEPDGLYFVDENGEKISKVGEQVDLNKVVFQTMPTTSLKNSRGIARHRADQKEQAEQMSKAWGLKRAELFAAPDNSYTTYEFVISRGIAEQNETRDGVKEKNHVGTILINSDEKQAEKVIASQEGLIIIPTENKIPHNGRLLNVPKGRPVLQYGDTLEFLNNKKFSKSQAKTIFEVMKAIADETVQQNKDGKPIQFNKAYSAFLQNVLFFVKGAVTSGNQIFIDESNLYLGGKPYSLVEFSKNEDAIIDQLLNTYNNVNNKTLTESFSEPFVEYYFEDGEIKDREWKNYQSYLLSAKTPDGKARNINETPLSTTIKQPSSGVPYTHKQKYAILVGMELPIVQVAKPAPTPVAPATPTARKIGDYTEGVTNTIELKQPLGNTDFTFTIDENNVVSVEVKESPVIDEISKDAAKVKPFFDFLKSINRFDATKENKQLLLDFVAISIASKLQPVLNKQLEAQAAPAAAPVVTPAPTAPVSDKKADIERRRQEELNSEKSFEGNRTQADLLRLPENFLTKGEYVQINNVNISQDSTMPDYRTGKYKVQMISVDVNGKNGIVTLSDGNEVITPKISDLINAKYDAELAALEGAKPAEEQTKTDPNKFKGFDGPSGDFRAVAAGEKGGMTEEELELFKQWHAENVPNIPFEVLENIIKTHDGGKAWGVFENGVAKFVRGGLRGTEYHEVFEGIWKAFLTEDQRQELMAEFRAKKGQFLDRESGKKIDYAEATDKQVKERIADDFSEFRLGKLPARSLGEKIRNFFKAIMDFFKSFVTKPSLKDKLFKAIDTGKFKERTLSQAPVKAGVNDVFQQSPELASIGTPQQYSAYLETIFPNSKVKDIVYHVGYNTIEKFVKRDNGIFFTDNLNYAKNLIIEKIKRDSEYAGYSMSNEEAEKALKVYRVLLHSNNIKNLTKVNSQIIKDLKKEDFDTVKGLEDSSNQVESYVVFEPEQIHVLGSKQDIEKFKNWIKENNLAEYRAVEGLTEQQTHEFVQDMTARSAGILFKEADKKALFTLERITSREMFSKIEEMYSIEKGPQGFSKRDLLSDKAWEQLQKKTKEQLRTLGISFSEDDKVDINNEEYDNRLYAPEAFSTDWKKSSPFAIKFTLATLLRTAATNQSGNLRMELPKVETNEIGYKLIDFSRAFATLLDKLSNTTSVTKAVDKLINLADSNADYVRLFRRLGGQTTAEGVSYIPFNDFKTYDWKLFINFMQVFTKQKPEAIIQYKSGSEVYSRPADIFTAAKETEKGWIENMKTLSKEQDSIIRRDGKIYKINSDAVKEMPINQPQEALSFLSEIGINLSMDDYLRMKDRNKFMKSVAKIHSYLGTNESIASITGATLGIGGPLAELSEMYVKATNPNQENTHFNVEGKRTQNYADNNAASLFENTFNESATLDELLQKMPQLNDMFSANSQVLKKGGQFFDEDGNRIKTIKVKHIEGTKVVDKDKGITSAKLNLGDRFVQEINQNLKGNYYILIPADSSTEWMMEMGNTISFSDVDSGRAWNKIYTAFNGYLLDDINIALDWKNRSKLDNVKPRAKELRFFKDILNDKDLKNINEMVERDATQDEIKDYLKENAASINESVKQYIDSTVEQTTSILKENKKILTTDKGFSYPELDDTFALSKSVAIDKLKMSEKDVQSVITFANVNYIINNIEYHKILFGDPFQFKITDKDGKVILDETKRIKSFLSPRRTTFDHPEYNNFLNRDYNKAGEIELQPGDPGYHNHKSYTNTVTFKDVNVAGSLANIIPAYGKVNEADAMSWLMDGTYREIKLKNGQWTDEAEAWHQWQMAFTRQNLPGYTYTNAALEKQDKETISKPAPKHTIEVLKPIVSGTKYGKATIDTVLDKFSQMPVYYSMVKGTNLEKLYIQMMNQGVGYAIVESGRKVGSEGKHSLYNSDGSFNENAFNNNVQVPWSAYGIQVETTYEGEKQQTRGSQLTKLSSMDLFENGEASEDAKKEYARNKDILDKMHENGYKELLEKLGIEDLGTEFILLKENHKTVSEVLMNEMLRRELSDNAKDTVQVDENNLFRIPFEASPSYVQIRNILYSMVDKAIRSPKVNGGAHVQVSATMFESATKGRSLALKTKDGWKKITKQEYEKLSEEDKKKVVLTDDTLKFYTEKDPYCEIMLPHWFGEKLMKAGKFKSDEELLNYLNNTKEGKKILTGIGFRIPTQAMSSVEVFRVARFLPQYMGATVVVPSEITAKAGSDFDIDKLNMYLKSVYVDKNGEVKLVQYQDSEEATKEFFGKIFDEKLEKTKVNKAEFFEAAQILIHGLDDPNNLVERYADLLDSILDTYSDPSDFEASIMSELQELGDKQLQAALKTKFVKDMYKKSLENEYYDSLEKMITLPENFRRLISPVNDAGLKKISEELDDLRGYNESNIKNRILNRNYMTSLRHAFIVAKRWVGIAAVNITGHSLAQKTKIYIDPAKFEQLSARDKRLIGNGTIALPHNKVVINGREYISLSGRMDADGKFYISDGLSGYATTFVDVAKDPYIMKIITSDLAVGTFMFLQRVGVPLKTAAMFMNQPIIKKYLEMLDAEGKRNLFDGNTIDAVKMFFGETTTDLINEVGVNVENLDENIKKYYAGEKLTQIENAEQWNILDEFLKYAKMAEFNFKFTQAINYDTTSFRNAESLFKKETLTDTAVETNIISSVDDILKSSFLGGQKKLLGLSSSAIGAILRLDRFDFRIITNDVLRRFAKKEFFSQDDYDRVANKIKASFLDFVIQTKTGINKEVKALLVDAGTSVASKLEKAKKDFPNNQLLKDLQVTSSPRMDSAKTVKLAVNLKEAYDENLYTGYMRELRDNPATRDLYYDIVMTSILQGTYQSAISIRNIIPIEDFAETVAPVIESLVSDPTVEAFSKSGWFERNNWNDEDVMPTASPTFYMLNPDQPPIGVDQYGNEIFQYQTSAYKDIKELNILGKDRKILLLGEKYNFRDVQNEFVKVPRIMQRKDGSYIDVMTGRTITGSAIKKMREKGDLSFRDYLGYQKVRDGYGNPVISSVDKKGNATYVYKLINLYGDGMYASEYYTELDPSPLNNGTLKIEQEIPDADIIAYYGANVPATQIADTQSTPVSIAPTQAVVSEKIVPTVSPEVTLEEDVQDIINRSNLEADEYEVVEINGKQRVIDKRFIPIKVKKGFSKFYSPRTDGAFMENYGKKVIIPGFEDINLMMEQDTNDIYELSTGLKVPTISTTQKAIKEEVEKLFKEKNIRKVLVDSKKIDVNNNLLIKIAPEGLPSIDNNNQNNCG